MNDLQARLLAKVDAYDKLFKDTFTGVNYGTALVLECAFNSFRALKGEIMRHEPSEQDVSPPNGGEDYRLVCMNCREIFPCQPLLDIAKEMGVGTLTVAAALAANNAALDLELEAL